MSVPLEDADVETSSADYARRFESPVGEWMLATQLKVTLDLLGGLGTGSVLEIGGGHGQLAPALAARGHPVTVLASSSGAVSVPLRSLVDDGTVGLVTGDLRNPPVETKSYDAVLCYRLLAHARDLPGLIAGLTRPARVAVIVDYATTRSFNAASELLFAAKKRVEKNTRPFLVMRDSAVADLFRQNGFRPGERRPQFFWPMALHRGLRSPALSRGLEATAAQLGLLSLFGSPVIARFDRV